MQSAGYTWSLRPDGEYWRWSAMGREDRAVLDQGLAPSRAAAAAFLVRAMSRAVSAEKGREAG